MKDFRKTFQQKKKPKEGNLYFGEPFRKRFVSKRFG
jgi:hypothetical protein